MYKKSVLQVESCFIANEARPTEFFGRFHCRNRLALDDFIFCSRKI